MDSRAGIVCAGFSFYNNFDSANLKHVEAISEGQHGKVNSSKTIIHESYDAEFNCWTKPDACGTPFENANRTWFYFGLQAPDSAMLVRLNIVDLNKQSKIYSQGMTPVCRVLPSKPKWERVNDKPVYSLNDDVFTLSFKFRTPENRNNIMYFAFTYPFTYLELDKMLVDIDSRYLRLKPICEDDIYYVREIMINSLDGRDVSLITISSYHGITAEQELRLKSLFPDVDTPRPFKFLNKKVIFVSSRVHPGETPSSFVFNGLLSLLLTRDDLTAQMLRRLYVFKMIPFLNPDGVARGHYRTDSRGVNLNRVYLNPSRLEHPSVYAARALIRYYHFGFEKEDIIPVCDHCKDMSSGESRRGNSESSDSESEDIPKRNRPEESQTLMNEDNAPSKNWCTRWHNFCRICGGELERSQSKEEVTFEKVVRGGHGDVVNTNESGLFMYLDLHGHASKKGVFMYGNHFDDVERNVECMLLPKLMSINNHNFHFNACNFTEKNMYLKDKRDGMSRAGSGRVAVLSLTGIIKSYTLECNYNTGRLVNVLPPAVKGLGGKMNSISVPPKYNPQVFEEVGKAVGSSILDLTGNNPYSRLPNSEFHTLTGLRNWLRTLAVTSNVTGKAFGKGSRPKGARVRAVTADAYANEYGIRVPRVKSKPTIVATPAAPRAPFIPQRYRTKRTVARPQQDKGRSKENYPQSQSSGTETRSRSIHKNCRSKLPKDIRLKTKHSDKVIVSKKGLTNRPVARQKQYKHKNDLKSKTEVTLQPKPETPPTYEKSAVSEGVHLREIRFYKNRKGCKTVVATYDNEDFVDDSLVVSWDATNRAKPQIHMHKARVLSAPPLGAKQTGKITVGKPISPRKMRVYRFHKERHPLPDDNKFASDSLRKVLSAESVHQTEKRKKKERKYSKYN